MWCSALSKQLTPEVDFVLLELCMHRWFIHARTGFMYSKVSPRWGVRRMTKRLLHSAILFYIIQGIRLFV